MTYLPYALRDAFEQDGSLGLYKNRKGEIYTIHEGKNVFFESIYNGVTGLSVLMKANNIPVNQWDYYAVEKYDDGITLILRQRTDTIDDPRDINRFHSYKVIGYTDEGEFIESGDFNIVGKNNTDEALSAKFRFNRSGVTPYSDLELWTLENSVLWDEYVITGGGYNYNKSYDESYPFNDATGGKSIGEVS